MDARQSGARIPGGLDLVVAVACGAIVANLYFAQPIVGDIAAALGLRPEQAGIIVTLAQLGYCAGLLFVVPLGDVVENRRLALAVLGIGVAASLTMMLTTNPTLFLIATLGLGIGSVSVQILLPFAAALADPMRQGIVVGRVMAGILTGIMLSRPVSSFVAEPFGWRAVFGLAAATSTVAAFLIWRLMPSRRPAVPMSYGNILRSLKTEAVRNRLLQRRAAYQFLMFYSYTVLWTALPLLLARAPYGLDHLQIGLVALAAAAGAVMSPVAGKMADRGLTGPGTSVALCAGVLAWAIALLGASGGSAGLSALLLGALLLDGAVPVALVLSQRELFAAHPDKRARLNGLFMAAFFVGGAIGASVGPWTLERFGWLGVTIVGMLGPLIALLFHLTTSARRAPTKASGGYVR